MHENMKFHLILKSRSFACEKNVQLREGLV
jgi:hypothetical protein